MLKLDGMEVVDKWNALVKLISWLRIKQETSLEKKVRQ